MQRRKLSGLIAILVVILLLVPSMCFAQEDDLGYQDDLNMEDSEELNTGEDISEDIIQMDCDFKDDADTVEKLEAFVEEYEEQLIFEDNEINNDQVDQKYFEEKYGEDIVLAVEENIEDLNEEAAEGDINITDNGSIYESDDEDLYVQGKVNINKSQTYWWGRIIYLNYSNANKLKKSMKGTSSRTGVISLALGGRFKVTSLAYGAVSSYANEVVYNINKYNKKNKGIKYKIWWSLYYKMRTQGQSW